MLLRFTKMHGLGNDFIVFDAPADPTVLAPSRLKTLADRRTGIGFDQALVLSPSPQNGIDTFYRIFNADGSEVEQCGNGARCIASLVGRRIGRSSVRLDSPGGQIDAVLLDDGQVALDMGIPDFAPASLPFEASREADVYPLQVHGSELQIGAVSMGNPHAVIRVASVRDAPVDTLGPAVENHARFPNRTNVGFMELVSADHIRLRVHERGVGETQACGTGACAAVAVGRRQGLLQQEVRADLPGGRMIIRWPGPGEHLFMTGPAQTVYEGTVELPAVEH